MKLNLEKMRSFVITQDDTPVIALNKPAERHSERSEEPHLFYLTY
jgi:hypothetical protein